MRTATLVWTCALMLTVAGDAHADPHRVGAEVGPVGACAQAWRNASSAYVHATPFEGCPSDLASCLGCLGETDPIDVGPPYVTVTFGTTCLGGGWKDGGVAVETNFSAGCGMQWLCRNVDLTCRLDDARGARPSP